MDIELSKEQKVIDYHVYDPRNSLFKGSARNRQEFTTFFCSESDSCTAFSEGTCALRSLSFGGFKTCPHGRVSRETGFTQRATKYHEWIIERKKKHENVTHLKGITKMQLTGDYVCLPYSYISDLKLDELEKGRFVLFENFNVDFIQKLFTSNPRRTWGNTIIEEYAEKVLPLIAIHLREKSPDLYKAWAETYPDTADKYKEQNHVGRKAKLKTIKAGSEVKTKKGILLWDGERASFDNYEIIWSPVKTKTNKLIIIPEDDAEIQITDNNQVTSDTVFID